MSVATFLSLYRAPASQDQATSGSGLSTWIEAPASEDRTRSTSGSVGGEIGTTAEASIPFLAKGTLEGSAKAELEVGTERTRSFARRGLNPVVEEIANSDFVLLLDDFHYMPRSVQEEVAKAIKEAVRLGVKTRTASVQHRGDDVVRANPELRGRVRSGDLSYWDAVELGLIADEGFRALNAALPAVAVERFSTEAAGSPQLMQSICLNACFVLGLREKHIMHRAVAVPEAEIRTVLEQTSASTDFRSLVDVLDAGPKARGIERKTYSFRDNSQGDVYRCVFGLRRVRWTVS